MLSACSITQTGTAVRLDTQAPREICIIESAKTVEGFLPALKSSLEYKGFSVRMLPPDASVGACPMTATYLAERSWDMAFYLSNAMIVVFKDRAKAGEALYDAPKGGMAMNLRIYDPTENKVRDMVDRLFPSGPPAAR